MSTTSVGMPAALAADASPSVTAVFPTPPFWLAIATTGMEEGIYAI